MLFLKKRNQDTKAGSMNKLKQMISCNETKVLRALLFDLSKAAIFAATMAGSAYGQTADGNAGINQANTFVRGYFDSGVNLVYAVGALIGLIGAVKVYQKWNHGDHDTGKVAAAWFGSCIFLVIVATVLKSFFGL
jgi:hypothetical protein